MKKKKVNTNGKLTNQLIIGKCHGLSLTIFIIAHGGGDHPNRMCGPSLGAGELWAYSISDTGVFVCDFYSSVCDVLLHWCFEIG